MSTEVLRRDACSSSCVNDFNAAYFPDSSVEDEKRRLESEIEELKMKIIGNTKRLQELAHSSGPVSFSTDAVQRFMKRHPAMSIECGDDVLRLKSCNQSVSFHTQHVDGYDGDCVIYPTLPIYGFTIEFLPDGDVSGRRHDFKYRELLSKAGARVERNTYGHPNATNDEGDSSTFYSICDGTNRFRSDYNGLCQTNRRHSGPELLRVLSKAATWLESANLSDMYNRPLSPIVESYPGESFSGGFVDGFLRVVQQPGGAIADFLNSSGEPIAAKILRVILNESGRNVIGDKWLHYLMFHIAWMTLLSRNFDRLRRQGCCLSSMEHAVETDLAIVASSDDLVSDLFAPGDVNDGEMARALELAVKAPQELVAYLRRSNCGDESLIDKFNLTDIRRFYE